MSKFSTSAVWGRALALSAALAWLSASVLAVQPQRWEQTTEADFEPGETQHTLVTNLGDVKLALSAETLGEMPEQASVVFDLQHTDDGTLYLAAGPEGKLLRRINGKIEVVAQPAGEQIFCLALTAEGELLVALSGPESRLAVLREDKLVDVVRLPGVRYVWDVLVTGQRFYVATGTDGQVLRVDLPGAQKPAVVEPAQPAPAAAKPEASTPAKPAAPVAEEASRSAADAAPANETTAPNMVGDELEADLPPAEAKSTEAPAEGAEGAASASAGEAVKTETAAQPAAPTTDQPPAETEQDPARPVTPNAHAPVVVTLLATRQTNVLCLGRDEQGRIYAGTDTDGLVYRITEQAEGDPQVFVMFDAPEPEIGALLVLPDGTVFAGTADADQARPGRLSRAAQSQSGRPEVKAVDKTKSEPVPPVPQPQPDPQPMQPQPAPTPGNVPHPAAGESTPQPKDDASGTPAAPAQPDLPPAEAAPAYTRELPELRPLSSSPMPGAAGLLVLAEQSGQPNQPGAGDAKSDAAPSAGDSAAKPAQPSAQQYDQLRQIVQQRLEAARDSGALQASPGGFQRQALKPGSAPRRGTAAKPAAANNKGNAVYRITRQGFVGEVFRESVMVLGLALDNDNNLLVATGNEGNLYRVNLAAQERTIVARLEPQQLVSLLRGPEGSLLIGTANPAQLLRLSSGFAPEGTFTSSVLDARQISVWGAVQLTADVPAGASVALQTRSGNVEDPERAAWSDWSEPQTMAHDEHHLAVAPREGRVSSPPARYLQYRLLLKGDPDSTPVIDSVTINYAMPNLRPSVRSITASYPGDAKPGAPAAGKPSPTPGGDRLREHESKLDIAWEAVDPNGDNLRYRLAFRIAGSDKWITLEDDLDKNRYQWDTQHVPDGRYQLQVTASDLPDNPPAGELTSSRTSDPVVVDNTPPAFVGLKGGKKDQTVAITGKVVDTLSPIASLHYAVDSADDWRTVLPRDGICDSTSESLVVTISGLAPGSHVITLRAVDQRGNAAYQAVFVND